MPKLVVDGAQLECTFGSAPRTLSVPGDATTGELRRGATVADHVGLTNIGTMGMCGSPTNPTVAAATAASGVLTPMPCQPDPAGPWLPGAPGIEIEGNIALDAVSVCNCKWAGVISVKDPNTVVDLNE